MDLRTLGYIIGYLLGWLLGPPTRAGTWDAASVRVMNQVGGSTTHASGTILGGDGDTGFVLTVRHLLDPGVGRLVVMRRDGHGYRAKLWATDEAADLSLLGIRDTGDLPAVRLADGQPARAVLAGFGKGFRSEEGRFTGTSTEGDGFYTFHPTEGDSGGGVFTPEGRLAGVAWGRGDDGGVAVGTARVRRFLRLARRDDESVPPPPEVATVANREKTSMTANGLIMLAALSQTPGDPTQLPTQPSKGIPERRLPSLPSKVQPTPQATPQATPLGTQYEYEQEQERAPAPRVQLAQAPRAPIIVRRRYVLRELAPVFEYEAPAYEEGEPIVMYERARPSLSFVPPSGGMRREQFSSSYSSTPIRRGLLGRALGRRAPGSRIDSSSSYMSESYEPRIGLSSAGGYCPPGLCIVP